MNLITQEELYREVYWELRREVYGALGLQIRAEFFKFQNFKSIILYAKNEFNYTRGIVYGIVLGIVLGSAQGIGWEIVLGIGWGIVLGIAQGIG